MKVSYSWLQTYFDKPLPPAGELAQLFNVHFAEVEAVEKAGDDTVLDIKTLADRNHYALSHFGVAIEAGAVIGRPIKFPARAKVAIDSNVSPVQVENKEPKLCRRYAARRVSGVQAGDSPSAIRARLAAIGARSINSIVDAANYVMFDLGQPLHAFDADKVRGPIAVRLAKPGEKITTLDGRDIELRDTDLVIADDEAPLAIAGIKGGKKAEVTAATKNIIIESANFEPSTVRKTSTRIGIRNDSSKRFENDFTPFIAEYALDAVTALIIQSAGGTAGPVTDIYPAPVKPWSIETDAAYINKVTGLSLAAQQIADTLALILCKTTVTGDRLSITPSYMRLDLTLPEDIADEVVRLYGYDKLEAKQAPETPRVPIDQTFYAIEMVKSLLADHGLSEIQTYTLVKSGEFEIAYPLASDKSALRERIMPQLAEALVKNAQNADLLGVDAIKVFEIGNIFRRSGELASLCIGVSQIKKKKGITSESLLRDIVAILESKAGPIADKVQTGPYGAIIEIDFSKIVEKMPKLPKAAANADFADLHIAPPAKVPQFKPFSQYPFIVRDIALFVPAGTADSAVSDVIKTAASQAAGAVLAKGPDIFDRFEKDGKVSYAFRMIFQSSDRTLSDDEANAFMVKVYEALKAKGWSVR